MKRYAEMFDQGVEAAKRYAEEVQSGAFPEPAHSFGLGNASSGAAPTAASNAAGNVVPLRPVYGPQE